MNNSVTLIGSKIKEVDFAIISAVLILMVYGLLLIYSADYAKGVSIHFTKQLYFALAGILVLAASAAIPAKLYFAGAYIVYLFCILLLILVPVAGVFGFGAKRWLTIGGIFVQPSEPAKIGLTLALARLLSFRTSQSGYMKIIGYTLILTMPMMILVLLQPDLGTSLMFPFIATSLLIWFGLPLKLFILSIMIGVALFTTLAEWVCIPILVVCLVLLWRQGWRLRGLISISVVCVMAIWAGPTVWSSLEPYQQRRLTSFMNPSADPLGSGYQIIQSKVAIGSGGIFGQGLLEGTQTQLRFLPEQHTDFVFALAGEEFGFVGTSIILMFFLILAWRGFNLAGRLKNQFMSLTVVGLLSMILCHAIVNVGMVVGLLPVTGLPLPFISYGGSFLLTCLTSIGIITSMSINKRER